MKMTYQLTCTNSHTECSSSLKFSEALICGHMHSFLYIPEVLSGFSIWRLKNYTMYSVITCSIGTPVPFFSILSKHVFIGAKTSAAHVKYFFSFSVATQLNCTQLRHKRPLWCQQKVISCHPQRSNTSSSSHQRFQFHNMECFGIHPLPLVTPLGLRGAWLSLLSILPLHTLMKWSLSLLLSRLSGPLPRFSPPKRCSSQLPTLITLLPHTCGHDLSAQ